MARTVECSAERRYVISRRASQAHVPPQTEGVAARFRKAQQVLHPLQVADGVKVAALRSQRSAVVSNVQRLVVRHPVRELGAVQAAGSEDLHPIDQNAVDVVTIPGNRAGVRASQRPDATGTAYRHPCYIAVAHRATVVAHETTNVSAARHAAAADAKVGDRCARIQLAEQTDIARRALIHIQAGDDMVRTVERPVESRDGIPGRGT